MFNLQKNKNKDKTIGFNVYGDVEILFPLLEDQIEKVNKKLPDEMDKKMVKIKKKLPGFMGRNMNSLYMFMETLKKEDHVRIQVMNSGTNEDSFVLRNMFKTMMGEAKKVTRDFLKEEKVSVVKIA